MSSPACDIDVLSATASLTFTQIADRAIQQQLTLEAPGLGRVDWAREILEELNRKLAENLPVGVKGVRIDATETNASINSIFGIAKELLSEGKISYLTLRQDNGDLACYGNAFERMFLECENKNEIREKAGTAALSNGKLCILRSLNFESPLFQRVFGLNPEQKLKWMEQIWKATAKALLKNQITQFQAATVFDFCTVISAGGSACRVDDEGFVFKGTGEPGCDITTYFPEAQELNLVLALKEAMQSLSSDTRWAFRVPLDGQLFKGATETFYHRLVEGKWMPHYQDSEGRHWGIILSPDLYYRLCCALNLEYAMPPNLVVGGLSSPVLFENPMYRPRFVQACCIEPPTEVHGRYSPPGATIAHDYAHLLMEAFNLRVPLIRVARALRVHGQEGLWRWFLDRNLRAYTIANTGPSLNFWYRIIGMFVGYAVDSDAVDSDAVAGIIAKEVVENASLYERWGIDTGIFDSITGYRRFRDSFRDSMLRKQDQQQFAGKLFQALINIRVDREIHAT